MSFNLSKEYSIFCWEASRKSKISIDSFLTTVTKVWSRSSRYTDTTDRIWHNFRKKLRGMRLLSKRRRLRCYFWNVLWVTARKNQLINRPLLKNHYRITKSKDRRQRISMLFQILMITMSMKAKMTELSPKKVSKKHIKQLILTQKISAKIS